MRRFFRIFGIVIALLIVLGGAVLTRALYVAGYFNEVTPKVAGTCETVTGAVGVEDIELDRETGTLFLSSQDRRPGADGQFKPGAIYAANLDDPKAPLRALVSTITDFHPHGISLYGDITGHKSLAVINHTLNGTNVMLFDVGDDSAAPTLTLRRTVTHPLFRNLNDITLVGHEAFYATNDHGSETALGEQLENWLLLPRANVVYYDGSVARIVAGNLNYANGINRNSDSSEIYVSETTGRTLSTFRRDATTGALAHIHALAIPMGLDNIDVDSEGTLWIGAHPRLLDFVAHAQDPEKLSPSVVVKVKPEGDATTYEVVYENKGEELSGASVAVAASNRLIIGAVFDPKILNCKLAK
ncbi:MAG: SMP-30/gluconolactonase/LRE family protein [Alphaproteobacteria bacterium]|nr:SMP-30/gluconolactonase/LRE family protein [Alphaproteobacteria bacterium]